MLCYFLLLFLYEQRLIYGQGLGLAGMWYVGSRAGYSMASYTKKMEGF